MNVFFSSGDIEAASAVFSFFGSTLKRSESLTVVRTVDFGGAGVTGGVTVAGGTS